MAGDESAGMSAGRLSVVDGAALAGGELSIVLKGVVQEFPAPEGAGVVRVIDELDLELRGPGIYMLLGPSGCGKSTLLYMMGGVRPFDVPSPTSGSVLVDGKPCDGAHDDVVMVFQRYGNRPDMSVRDNVAFPFRFALWKKRVSPAEVDARVDEMLRAVGSGRQGDVAAVSAFGWAESAGGVGAGVGASAAVSVDG
jgi:ABC-type Fe3+/spermidine/putrescine transport system ATPase subunit